MDKNEDCSCNKEECDLCWLSRPFSEEEWKVIEESEEDDLRNTKGR